MIEALAARPANARFVAAVGGRPGFVNLHAMDVSSGVRKSSPQGQFRLMATDPLKPTVFVVDDDPSVRVAILRLFESVGLNCETFASGADFLKRAEQGVMGCVVLDVRMPGPSGLELQRLLRDAGHDLPVIFVTAFADVPLTVRAMKAGALEVLTKPFDDQALLDVVHFGLEQGRRRQEEHNEIKRLQVRYDTLTPREREVMAMVVTGKLNKQIAAELGTTEKTIKVHRAQVMHKMAADSVAVLVRMADRLKPSAKRPS